MRVNISALTKLGLPLAAQNFLLSLNIHTAEDLYNWWEKEKTRTLESFVAKLSQYRCGKSNAPAIWEFCAKNEKDGLWNDIVEPQCNVNWEERRFELAKAAMVALIRCNDHPLGTYTLAEDACHIANNMIKHLKKQ